MLEAMDAASEPGSDDIEARTKDLDGLVGEECRGEFGRELVGCVCWLATAIEEPGSGRLRNLDLACLRVLAAGALSVGWRVASALYVERRPSGVDRVRPHSVGSAAVCRPDRVGAVFAILQQELQSHAHIRLHLGKTQVWNRGGVVPVGIEQLTRLARRVKPDAVVWRGDTELPLSQQGIRVLGVPIGQPEFVRHFLEKKNQEHQTLFQRIPWLNDLQAAWLLLLMCGSPRANFWLRAVRPELTDSLAVRHDEDVWSCMRTILGSPTAPPLARVISTLPLSAGGLRLTSAQRSR